MTAGDTYPEFSLFCGVALRHQGIRSQNSLVLAIWLKGAFAQPIVEPTHFCVVTKRWLGIHSLNGCTKKPLVFAHKKCEFVENVTQLPSAQFFYQKPLKLHQCSPKPHSPPTFLFLPKDPPFLRRLKLHGQNVPKTASPPHSEKIVFLGDPKTQEPKIQQKAINWSIFIYFQENRLPGKIIYLSKNALLFSENHDFLFPLPLMLSYENTHELSIFSKTSFRKPC